MFALSIDRVRRRAAGVVLRRRGPLQHQPDGALRHEDGDDVPRPLRRGVVGRVPPHGARVQGHRRRRAPGPARRAAHTGEMRAPRRAVTLATSRKRHRGTSDASQSWFSIVTSGERFYSAAALHGNNHCSARNFARMVCINRSNGRLQSFVWAEYISLDHR
jgi:hypothetical protein